jgi:tRNA(fMet)-specific endonuclease VapC
VSRYLIDTNILSEPLKPQPNPAASERTRLTALGLPPAYADGKIAAIAYTNGLILLTHNISDFAGFKDLKIEDWLS